MKVGRGEGQGCTESAPNIRQPGGSSSGGTAAVCAGQWLAH